MEGSKTILASEEIARRHSENLDDQIKRLARFIADEVPGEPSRSEGAVDTAIRIIREQQFKEISQ